MIVTKEINVSFSPPWEGILNYDDHFSSFFLSRLRIYPPPPSVWVAVSYVARAVRPSESAVWGMGGARVGNYGCDA